MFDRTKLERFLDSLDVETAFPDCALKKIIVDMAPQSHLGDLMDKYDLFVQGNFNHNYGIEEFPDLRAEAIRSLRQPDVHAAVVDLQHPAQESIHHGQREDS